MEKEDKYALLIDADNISPKYIDIILSESKEFGTVSIRRIYGDWTDPAKSTWKKVLLAHSISPIQQYNYSVGKNSSDSAMIIDAMDILYGSEVDGFVIASSDSDFTRLAMRLREAGKDIIGMGESKTPSAFVKACRMFKTLDVLYKATSPKNKKPLVEADAESQDEGIKTAGSVEEGRLMKGWDSTDRWHSLDDIHSMEDEHSMEEDHSVDVAPITSIEVVMRTILDLVDLKADDDGWLFLGELGNYLLKEYPDFDCRNYGYKKLVELVKDCSQLEIKSQKAKNGKITLIYIKKA